MRFRKFSLFHTFSHIPVNKGAFGIHKIELVIESCPGLSYGSSVGEHADGALHLGQISSGNHSWRLVVDTHLETSWAPVANCGSRRRQGASEGGHWVWWR